MPVDIFQHNDGAVNQHSDRKRNACQTDDIQISSQKVHENKGADDTDGNRGGDNDGRCKTSQKNQQHDNSQHPPYQDVLADQRNCPANIVALIIDPVQRNLFRGKFFRIQPVDDLLEPIRKLQNIGIRFGLDADGNAFLAQMQHGSVELFIPETHLCQIRHLDALESGGPDNNIFDVLRGFKFGHRPDSVISSPHPQGAGGNVDVF